ncbi:Non-heme dioxygenase in morphine synthesis N-terminal-containing protein 3 [Elsinoe fawcettii]|nr:Non-heme dioxygenase in morphine synthesis N-terminal-containing protein 3 [Elsinoe fawcettii]
MDVELRRERQAVALLPRLDCSLYTDGTKTERRQFAKLLRASLEQHGFVKLIGHGISAESVEQLFHSADKLFEMPVQSKEKIAHQPGPDPQRGWSKIGSENAAKLYAALQSSSQVVDVVDAREHFDQGSEHDLLYPNRWPDENDLPGFRLLAESAYRALHKVRNTILEALELSFDLAPGSFTARCSTSADELRLNRYPAIDVREINNGRVSRIWPHTDLGVITCLFQDRVGGLEIEDRGKLGSFLPVLRGSPCEMVVNVSETLERWTNGRLRAGVHQVTVPAYLKHASTGLVPARISVPYFVKADREASAGPLPDFVADGEAPSFEDMTALEYHMQRLAKAY